MPEETGAILAVPTNVVTGFLGVGKTTAISNLLQKRPAGERWAVLVNEFGEIGVDGSLLEGQGGGEGGVYIREVPGGCMCCTAGLPMQIALNQLLRRAKPQRLLIEPTGLGHPAEVLESLSSEHYREVLLLQRTLTLVDARNLSDERYRSHPAFRQQLEIADVIVANKQDLYAPADVDALRGYAAEHNPAADLVFTRFGALRSEWLDGPNAHVFSPCSDHVPEPEPEPEPGLSAEDRSDPLGDGGIIKAVNEGEGFHSVGWRFDPHYVFSKMRLIALLSGLSAERMKAVFITESGVFGYNLTRDGLTEIELDECVESRMEVIADVIDSGLERQLMDCILSPPVPAGSRASC